jgi:phage gp45-like
MPLDKLNRPIVVGDTVIYPAYNQGINMVLKQGKVTELDKTQVFIRTKLLNTRHNIQEVVVVTSQISLNMQEYPENFL